MKKHIVIIASLLLPLGMFVLNSAHAASHKRTSHHQHVKQSNNSTKVNINTANVAQLAVIKGIGPKKAQAIVNYRKSNGSFSSVNGLTKVKGIGEKTLTRIEAKNPGRLTTNK